ncbi:MAG TPA: hypothetical protein VK421_06530 [Pyrinomonadaceae bacterium]|nr:hypothetical protein [Pyrinomonadaceae bacterium]
MRRFKLFSALSAALLLSLSFVASAVPAFAQQQASAAAPASSSAGLDTERIIRSFVAKEVEFRRALTQYGFKRDAIVQTIGMGGQISGEYRRTSNFTFDDAGRRFERVTFAPMSTLKEIELTPEDIEDLSGVQTFSLNPSNAHLYNITYAGQERIDELDLYIFDISPKVMPDPKTKERRFQGRVWVDKQDLQIVKVRGKGVPEGKQRFPTFETYRENIDGLYWFPTYTYADEKLVFPNGQVTHVRMRIKFTDFARARGSVKIIEEGEPGDVPEEKPSPTPRRKP